MIRTRMTLAAAAFVAAGSLAGTAAADPPDSTNANGCVGALLSLSAHIYTNDDTIHGGFGAEAKALGLNPGQAIQAYNNAVCKA